MNVKKTAFTLLSAALAALMLIGCTARHEAANGSKVTTTPEVTVQTQTSNPYCMEEYEQLLKFFEIVDENGVKNGEKCFKNYDPTRVDFWGTELDSGYGPCLDWDENGNLTAIVLRGTEDNPLQLIGTLNMQEFNELRYFSVEHIVFENLDIEDFSKLSEVECLHAAKEATVIGDFICLNFDISSKGHCHYESNGRWDIVTSIPLAFTVDLTVEGSGIVGVKGKNDEHYYIAEVYAEPAEGHKFLGWYNADGKLISTEAEIELSYEHDTGWSVHDFTGIAKFE